MNRPWTACTVMLMALGGLLLFMGSARRQASLRESSLDRSQAGFHHVIYCDLGSADPVGRGYESGCGYDRTTGIRYRQPAPRRGWSMIVEQHLALTMESIQLLKSEAATSRALLYRENPSLIPLEASHPSAPAFYNRQAARSYAAAQGQAWRESVSLLPSSAAPATASLPVLRLELRPTRTSPWGLGHATSCLNSLVSTIRRYPAQHNVRITYTALQLRSQRLLESMAAGDQAQLALQGRRDYTQSAQVIGFEADEYAELLDRALEKLPPPDKMEEPRQFQPAPSRQKLLRMASATLQRVSELLDATANQLERAAGDEVATRSKRPAQR